MAKWVRSGALEHAPQLVAELGGDYALFARQLGLPDDPMAQPDLPVPVENAQSLLQHAQMTLGEECFGLRLGSLQGMTLFGAMAPLFTSAETIGALLADMANFFPLHTQGTIIGLVREADGLSLSYEMAVGAGASQRQVIELGFGILCTELRRHVPQWVPSAIYLRHAAPADRHWHRRILGSNIFYNAERNAVFIDAQMLGQPCLGADRQMHDALRAQYHLARRSASGLIVVQVEILVRAMLPFAAMDLARIAKMLGHSCRTLQRRLADEGTSFTAIVDQARVTLAHNYLSESTLSVGQIAEILQFSESSALSRFLRHRLGLSPRQIRRMAH